MANFFEDRIVEHPGRVRLAEVETDVYDVTPEEGTITQEGTALNAQSLEDGIQAMIDAALTDFNITAGGSVQVRNIQTGTVYFPARVNTAQAVSVTFNHEFENVPKVTLTPITTGPQVCHASVANVTTTGFTAYLYRTNNYSTTVNYIAIDA